MSWTTPRTWTDDEVVTAALLNAHVRDDLSYLLSGRPVSALYRAGAYNTTSTSFVDIDATNLKITQMVESGRMLLVALLELEADNTAGNNPEIEFGIDGTTYTGKLASVQQNNRHGAGALTLVSGLSVASHDFTVRYRSAAAGATTTARNINFLGIEV